MNSTILYATPGQVQDYIMEQQIKTRSITTFPEALIQLKQKNRLLTVKPEMPVFRDGMSTDEFNDLMRNCPFNASQIINGYLGHPGEELVEENEMIPLGKDVFCVKNLPQVDESAHFHDYFEIMYVYEGSFKLIFEHDALNLTEGDIVIIAPHSSHSMLNVPESLILTLVARKSTFDGIFGSLLNNKSLISLFFRNTLYNPRQANYLLLRTGPSATLRRTVQQLAYEGSREDPYANACSIGLLNLFLAQALREYSDTIRLYNLEGFSEKTFDFALILQHIQQNYRTISLASLARSFHFSEAYLSKMIHRNMGEGFATVIRSLKMSKAIEYLLNTSMKINEIAEQVGYDSVDHFSRTFKKLYKVSPHDYRIGLRG